MSSGVEARIALDAAVVLSLGMSRVAGKAAGLTGAGAEALAALAQGRADARAAALAEVERHDRALRDVIDRNARIAILADAQVEAGLKVPLPAPLPPGDQSPDELAAWCAATDHALDEADRQIREQRAQQVAAQIFKIPEGGLQADLTAPELSKQTEAKPAEQTKDKPAQTKDEPAQTKDKPAQTAEDKSKGLAVTLARVLARLAPDTAAADRERATEAATRLVEARTDTEAEGLLSEVRLRVQEANRNTDRRRDEERTRAAERAAHEQAEAERQYVLDAVTSAFQDMGYDVDAGFETLTADDGSVVLTRGNWPDHSVKMRIEDAHELRAAMVRTRAPQSEDDRRRDAEREEEWCTAFEAARNRLAAAGIHSNVTWRVEPGDQELPVAAQSRQTRARAEQRARQREREL